MWHCLEINSALTTNYWQCSSKHLDYWPQPLQQYFAWENKIYLKGLSYPPYWLKIQWKTTCWWTFKKIMRWYKSCCFSWWSTWSPKWSDEHSVKIQSLTFIRKWHTGNDVSCTTRWHQNQQWTINHSFSLFLTSQWLRL